MIDIQAWFEEFTASLRDDAERGRELLEIISDAANELYCNAITAMHLRRYGRERSADGLFWVRSEWEKTDLSYGVATTHFADWDDAWPHATGDLGQIEAKLVYAHWWPSQTTASITNVRSTLEQRMHRDLERRRDDTAAGQTYHALVWLFDDQRDPARSGAGAQNAAATTLRASFGDRVTPFRLVAKADLGRIWPTVEIEKTYAAELRIALAELRSTE